MNSTKWSFTTLVAALLAFFGGRATTPSQPTKPTPPDSAIVAPGGGQTAPTPPETTITPPPVVTPPSTGNYVAFKRDDFTGYKTTVDLLANVTANVTGGTSHGSPLYTDGRNANLASIDETIQYNGHHTLKLSQPGGTDAGPELWTGLTPSLSHLWIRAHIRFMPGWTTTGTTASSNAYKLLGWNYSTVDGSGRLEITNTTQYDFYWGMFTKNTNIVAGGGNHCNAGQVATEWKDGVWYTYIIEVDNTQKTAMTRFWWAKDGSTPALRCSTPGTMVNGALVPNVDAVNWGMNFNQVRAANQNQFLSYGDWEVVDGSKFANPFGVK